MKYEWRKYIDEMRRDGYAVVVFNPDELGDVRASLIEGYLVSQGNEEIMLQQSYKRLNLELFDNTQENEDEAR